MSGVTVSVVTKEPDESRFELALEYYVHPAVREVVISAVISTKKENISRMKKNGCLYLFTARFSVHFLFSSTCRMFC